MVENGLISNSTFEYAKSFSSGIPSSSTRSGRTFHRDSESFDPQENEDPEVSLASFPFSHFSEIAVTVTGSSSDIDNIFQTFSHSSSPRAFAIDSGCHLSFSSARSYIHL